MRAAHRALLTGLALLLATAVGLQVLPSRELPVVKRGTPLADYLPREMAGWNSEDRPIGETEAQVKVAEKVLNYDEAILRIYRKGDQEFSVYIAYWRAGKMPAREISFHVPDVCWVLAGWKQCAADRHYQREFEGRWLAPAQYREFEEPNARQYVLYWHVLNGRTVNFNPGGAPSQLNALKAVLRHGLNQRGEQYFIRIASRSPPDEYWNDEGFQEVMELIAQLGPGLDSTGENAAGDLGPAGANGQVSRRDAGKEVTPPTSTH
jgi:hypothetical protein